MTSTRQSYNQDLEELRNAILEMGTCVELAIGQAIASLTTQDIEIAKQVMAVMTILIIWKVPLKINV